MESFRYTIKQRIEDKWDFYDIASTREEARELFAYFGGNSIIHYKVSDYEDNMWEYYHMGTVDTVEEHMYEKYRDDFLNDEHWDEFIQMYVDLYFEFGEYNKKIK